jgi:hypothetical protein
MASRTIELEEIDYQDLEKAAESAGVSIQSLLKQLLTKHQMTDKPTSDGILNAQRDQQQQNRWAQFSVRIRKNPPLRGVGEYVRKWFSRIQRGFRI